MAWCLERLRGYLNTVQPFAYLPCAEYRNFILDCSYKYMWNAVSQFDAKHRIKLASRGSLEFGTIDHTLFIMTFHSSTARKNGTCFRCKSTDHFVGNCLFQEERKEPTPRSGSYNQPIAYHQGKEICTSSRTRNDTLACKRAPVCKICRGPMPLSRCNVCSPQSQP